MHAVFAAGYGSARSFGAQNGGRAAIPGVNTPAPRNAMDARDAFDRLFRK